MHGGWLVPILFGLAWLVLFGWLRARPGRGGGGPDALATLRDRLTRGEIDAEEHGRRRRVLESRA